VAPERAFDSVAYAPELAWVSADDLFADADAEEDALRPAPWLFRNPGPMRRKDEGAIKNGEGDADLDARILANATRIRVAEQALAQAPPADQLGLRLRLSAYRRHQEMLQDRRRRMHS
jgi:hypothetical protein